MRLILRLISTFPQLPPNNEPVVTTSLKMLQYNSWNEKMEWTVFSCTKNIPGPEMSVYLCFHLPSPQLPRGCLRVQVHNEIPRKPYDGISIQHQKNVYLSHTANQLWRKQERIQIFLLMDEANCDSFFLSLPALKDLTNIQEHTPSKAEHFGNSLLYY